MKLKGTQNGTVSSINSRLKALVFKYGIVLVLLAICAVSVLINPVFMTTNNLLNILRQACVTALIALAEGILILSGGIDLAAGSSLALSGILAIPAIMATNSIVVGLLVAIGIGMLCSLVTALTVAYLDMPPFVVTLALMMSIRGVIFVITGGVVLTKTGDLFKIMGQGYVGPIPIPVIVMLVATTIIWIVLTKTRFGRNLFAVGGNREAARASGINIKKVSIGSFLLSGALIGLGGYMYMSRVNAGVPTGGLTYEGLGISGAIIGGVSFTGGIGSAWGMMIGALIMAVINNALNLAMVDSYIQQIISGAIIIAAVALDLQTKKRRFGR